MWASSRRSPSGRRWISIRSSSSSRSSSSRWAFMDTYSPEAIEKAPPTMPATPAIRTAELCGWAPAAPGRRWAVALDLVGRYDLSRDDMAELLAGEPPYRLAQLWEGLYRHGVDPPELTVLPRPLRDRLALEPRLAPDLVELRRSTSERGEVVKWLWLLAGGGRIETVLMHYRDRSTVCISSQAGCAMGCGFCATGQAGFQRHRTAGEMWQQVVRAGRAARAVGRRLPDRRAGGLGQP